MKEYILTLNNVAGGYQNGIDILHGVDLQVEKGELVGVIGLNGSGKSTLGKAIVNMLPYKSGDVIFSGKNVSTVATDDIARTGIAFMQQGGSVFQNLTVRENILLASNGCQEAIDNLRSLIPLLNGSKNEMNMMADKLSGGQKHQLALAMALVSRPRMLILDEPSAGLSPKSAEQMYNILHNLAESLDITIILIEQNIPKVIEFCSRVCLMKQGQIAAELRSPSIDEIENIMFN